MRPRAVATVVAAGLDLQQWPYISVCCEVSEEALAVMAPELVAGLGAAQVERDLGMVLVMAYTLAFAKLSSHSSIHRAPEFQRLA